MNSLSLGRARMRLSPLDIVARELAQRSLLSLVVCSGLVRRGGGGGANTTVHCSTVTSFPALPSLHSEMLRLLDSPRLCSGSTVIK